MPFKFAPTTVTANGANNQRPQDLDYDGVAVTPSDSTDLPNGICKAVVATGAGNIVMTVPGASSNVTVPVSANAIVHVPASRILATSTTATGIFALY